MKVEMMNEIESAIAEWVDRNTTSVSSTYSDMDVIEAICQKGYPAKDVTEAFRNLVSRELISHVPNGGVSFRFPDEDKTQGVPNMEQISQVLAATTALKHDPVNSPSHYTRGGIEAIDFIEAKGLGFCLGNVVKYVSRAGFKADAKLQDLEKARWYLNREIERLKQGE